MSAAPPPASPSSRSPYAAPAPSGTAGLPWYRVLVRLVLVVVLAQVLGTLVATLVAVPLDLGAHPTAVASLFWVVPGLLAGVALGVLLRPRAAGLPWRLAGAAAVVGAVSYLLLVLLGRSRAGAGGDPVLSAALLGAVLGCVALQTLAALGLWILRRRPRSPR